MELLLVLIITVIVVGGAFLIAQLYRVRLQEKRLVWLNSQSYIMLRIDVPKNNDKPPLSAEQMFAAIHGVYSDSAMFQPELSFEIVAKEKFIQFFVRIPEHIVDFVEGQIYAQYPTVEIHKVDDYAGRQFIDNKNYAICELKNTKPDVYPIKLFSDFEVDPISGITSVMTNLNPDEELCIQTIIRPVGDEWQEKGNAMIESVRSGKPIGAGGTFKVVGGGFTKFVKMVLLQAIKPGSEITEAENKKVLSGPVEEALKQIEMKILKLGYQVKIRILAISSDEVSAGVKAQSLAAAYKQYNTTNLNGFISGPVSINNNSTLNEYFSRSFEDNGCILNIGELASVFHFPHQSVATPNIVWSGAKKGEPPANLPLFENTPAEALTVIGETNFRNVYQKFGIKKDDRRRHIYIIGKSGVGKSVLMENMAIDDVWKDRGVVIVDPHGEFAEKILACIPDNRINDVIVFDPADRAYPIAFNLLESVDDDFKGMVASGFVGIFKKIFGNSWGPRLEHILRNTVLALLDYPDSTMLDIPKMLTDGRFRDKVVEYVKDPVIKDFWILEFAQYDNKFRTEAVSPILNKVGQFLATATIRNIVGQARSTLNIRDIMDNQKIMIVNLSRGKIGEDNSALLGAMMITKIQLAAMSRADVPVDQRPDSYLYVDEFQNFATDSFAVILSEARKYHLNLTIANQYIAQLPEEVRDAVFGNAGTLITFRVGGADADFLVKEYEPVFDVNDLVNLDKYNIYIKLLVDGVASPAFSSRTLAPVERITGNTEKIISVSRKKYSRDRAVVEEMIMNRSKQEQKELKAEAELFKEGGLEALLVKKKQSFPDKVENKIVKAKIDSEIENVPKDKKEEKVPFVNQNQSESPKDKIESVSTKAISSNIMSQEEKEIKTEESVRNIDDNSDQIVASTSVSNDSGEYEINTSNTAKEKKQRILKYQNILGNLIYKEQTARGGIKWYIGEPIDEARMSELGIVIDDKARKMMELAKRVAKINDITQKDDSRNADKKKNQHQRENKSHQDYQEHNNAKKQEVITKDDKSQNSVILDQLKKVDKGDDRKGTKIDNINIAKGDDSAENSISRTDNDSLVANNLPNNVSGSSDNNDKDVESGEVIEEGEEIKL